MMRYRMTDDQYIELIHAVRSAPLICVGVVAPPSPEECFKAAWRKIAKECGCKAETVAPLVFSDHEFYAEPSAGSV